MSISFDRMVMQGLRTALDALNKSVKASIKDRCNVLEGKFPVGDQRERAKIEAAVDIIAEYVGQHPGCIAKEGGAVLRVAQAINLSPEKLEKITQQLGLSQEKKLAKSAPPLPLQAAPSASVAHTADVITPQAVRHEPAPVSGAFDKQPLISTSYEIYSLMSSLEEDEMRLLVLARNDIVQEALLNSKEITEDRKKALREDETLIERDDFLQQVSTDLNKLLPKEAVELRRKDMELLIPIIGENVLAEYAKSVGFEPIALGLAKPYTFGEDRVRFLCNGNNEAMGCAVERGIFVELGENGVPSSRSGGPFSMGMGDGNTPPVSAPEAAAPSDMHTDTAADQPAMDDDSSQYDRPTVPTLMACVHNPGCAPVDEGVVVDGTVFGRPSINDDKRPSEPPPPSTPTRQTIGFDGNDWMRNDSVGSWGQIRPGM